MSITSDLAIAAAGFGAGMVNTIVGSGSLITFPTLLSLGYSPLVANVSNTLGLVPGSISGAIGYRKELEGQRQRAIKLSVFALLGGVVGALLLVTYPGAFQQIVPYLIIAAVVLMALQPRISKALSSRDKSHITSGLIYGGVFLTAIYGGYFGAAQGVVLIALLAIGIDDSLQRLNALKNVLAGLVNGIAAIFFIIVTHVAYTPALLIAISSVIGAQVGAKVGRKIPQKVLRAIVVIVGLGVAISLLAKG
ncbi:MAG: sulfite exporter TauE/SafE family protein [Actinomycetota bacterium]|nr:sulfite exporter TauE/SafE family protein [Actinomycetota bacterium]